MELASTTHRCGSRSCKQKDDIRNGDRAEGLKGVVMMLVGGTVSPRSCGTTVELKKNSWRQVHSSTHPMVREKKMSTKRAIWTRAAVSSDERVTADEEISEFAKKLGLMVWNCVCFLFFLFFSFLFCGGKGVEGSSLPPRQ